MSPLDQVKIGNLQRLQALWKQWKEDAGCDKNVIMTLDAPPTQNSSSEAPLQLPFFGIKPSIIQSVGITNTIDPKSVYGKYPRDFQVLPTKCPFLDEVEEADKAAVKAFWKGKGCQFRFLTFPTSDKSEIYLLVTASGFPQQLKIFVEDLPERVVFRCDFKEDIFANIHQSNIITLNLNPMEERLMKLLGARVLHLFLRQFLWTIPWEISESGLKAIYASYLQCGISELENSTLDLTFLKADAMHILPFYESDLDQADCPGMPMIKVGEKLEKLGHFKWAAKLYTEIGEKYLQGRPREFMMHEFAGLAWKRRLDDDLAMDSYMRALHLFGENNLTDNWWTKVDGGAVVLISNVMSLLFEINEEPFSRKNYDDSGRVTLQLDSNMKMLAAMSALLSCIGFRPINPFIIRLLALDGGAFRSLLKPKYKSSNKARKKLISIFGSGSVAKFQNNLFEALRADKSTMTISPKGYLESPGMVDYRKDAGRDMGEERIYKFNES